MLIIGLAGARNAVELQTGEGFWQQEAVQALDAIDEESPAIPEKRYKQAEKVVRRKDAAEFKPR